MSSSSGSEHRPARQRRVEATGDTVDFLVSYTLEDRDWAEWIASHLGALGYSYALQEPPSGPGIDPFREAGAATGAGQDVILILSLAFVEALLTSGAALGDRLPGPGRALSVQIEPLDLPADLQDRPTARMHEAADDYATSRDLLLDAVRVITPEPAADRATASSPRRIGLPAPVALAESYPVPAPPSELVGAPAAPLSTTAAVGAATAGLLAAATADPATGGGGSGERYGGRSVGLLGGDRPSGDDISVVPATSESGDDDEAPAVGHTRLDSMLANLRAAGPLDPPDADTPDAERAAATDDAALTTAATASPEATVLPGGVIDLTGGDRLPPVDTDVDAGPAADSAPIDLTVEAPDGAGPAGAGLVDAPVGPPDAVADEAVVDGVTGTAAGASAAGPAAGAPGTTRLANPGPVLFWGRTEELARLAAGVPSAGVDNPTVVALTGPAGSGKTCLAAEHVNRQGAAVDLVWWVRAEHRASSVADARTLAGRLALTEADTPGAEVMGSLRRWLSSTPQRWLLVLDGVSSWYDVADLVPDRGHGQVLVTSANRALGGPATVMELDPLGEPVATSFLLARTSRDDGPGAERAARRLGGLPVALELAASYVLATGVGFDDYLATLDDHSAPRGLQVNQPVTVVESGVLSALRAVAELDPTVVGSLAALGSATADAALPQRLVANVGAHSGMPVVDVASTYGLLRADGRSAVIPSAVRQALSFLLGPDAGGDGRRRLAGALADATATATADELDVLAPHAAQLVSVLGAASETTPEAAQLAGLATSWAEAQGAASEAVALGEHSLNLHEGALGPHDPATHSARRLLANLYVEAGDTTRALATQAAVLVDCEVAFGVDDPRTVHACANLAANYGATGDHAHAVHYGEQAVAGLTRLYGPTHPDVAAAAELLAESRRELVTASDVAPVNFVSSAEPTTAAGAPATPDADADAGEATAPGDLGRVVAPPAVFLSPAPDDAPWAIGVDASADGEVRRLTGMLAEIEAASGPESLDALATRHELAVAYGDAGDHLTAGLILGEVVTSCRQVLGPDHPDTLTARANLANAYAEAGNYRAAIGEQAEVVADHERVLGPDDPLTLTARNSLANSYASAGLHDQALAEQERVVADYARTHGAEHPSTLTAEHNLANSYADLGRHQEALALRQQVLARREAILGADHPQTMGARNNLANTYADLGRHGEALELRRQVVDDRERLLGADHPQTLGARNNLANSHADLGQHADALLLRVEVLEGRERVLGADHPHTLTARNNLANSYAGLERHDEALALRLRALADCERVLGPDHPHTLTARNNLANTRAALGDEAEATRLRAEIAAAYGLDAPPPPPPPLLAPPSAAVGASVGADAAEALGHHPGVGLGTATSGTANSLGNATGNAVGGNGSSNGSAVATVWNADAEGASAAAAADAAAVETAADAAPPAATGDAPAPVAKRKRKFWFWTR